MKRLSLKEAFAIATIHDALRELCIRGNSAVVEMYRATITIKVYPETAKEAGDLKKILCFFKDEDDEIGITHFPSSDDSPEFYKVELKKSMV